MSVGSERIHLCASANEESDSLVDNAPLTPGVEIDLVLPRAAEVVGWHCPFFCVTPWPSHGVSLCTHGSSCEYGIASTELDGRLQSRYRPPTYQAG